MRPLALTSLVVLLTACTKNEPAPASIVRTANESTLTTQPSDDPAPEADLSGLDPVLQVELIKWHASLRAAENAGASEQARLRSARMRGWIITNLDDAAVTQLGVTVSSRLGDSVIGEFWLRDAARLARTPGISRVTPEAPMHPEANE